MKKNILISFFGPSGSGKSTCYKFAEDYLLKERYTVFHVNVATPLRNIQSYAYKIFGKVNMDPFSQDFKQDGQLLGFLAKHFESHLGQIFREAVENILKQGPDQKIAIINTDCRNNAHNVLEDLGFVFVRMETNAEILSERRKARGDLTPFDHTSSVEQYNNIKEACVIKNNRTLEYLRDNVENVLKNLLN
ncbi:MAG: hypothetical protein HY225_01710 [Candidatus Vogelbacteria bacterium]|nr:hypothetical protein [Candidatus Vogelbacteria bacterium]